MTRDGDDYLSQRLLANRRLQGMKYPSDAFHENIRYWRLVSIGGVLGGCLPNELGLEMLYSTCDKTLLGNEHKLTLCSQGSKYFDSKLFVETSSSIFEPRDSTSLQELRTLYHHTASHPLSMLTLIGLHDVGLAVVQVKWLTSCLNQKT